MNDAPTPRLRDLQLDERRLGELLFFRDADLELIRRMLDDCPIREVQAEEQVIIPGAERSEIYVILSGRLRIHLNSPQNPCLTYLGAGESAGEMSAFDHEAASAYVIADQPSRLLAIPDEALWRLINRSHAVARNLLYQLSGRLRSGNAAISESLELQQLYEQYAKVDSLTGLHNRRWLDEVLPRIVARCRRGEHPLSLVMLDVDHFKRFNDDHGHVAGDEALRALGRLLNHHLRPNDLAARYGGEEFLVILADTDLDEAMHVAERLREAAAAEPLTDIDGAPLPSITLSLGVTQAVHGEGIQPLIQRADAALYRAKSSGRNRVSR